MSPESGRLPLPESYPSGIAGTMNDQPAAVALRDNVSLLMMREVPSGTIFIGTVIVDFNVEFLI